MRFRTWIVLVVVVVLMALPVVFSQSIGRYVIGRLLVYAGKSLKGEVTWQSIQGNPFLNPSVRGLKAVVGRDSVLASEVGLRYDLASLVRGRFAIADAHASGLRAFISSGPRPGTGADSVRTKLSFPTLVVGALHLSGGQVYVDTVLRADSVEMVLSLTSGGSLLEAELVRGRCSLVRESVGIRSMRARARLTSDSLALTDLEVATKESRVKADLKLALAQVGFEIGLDSLSISLPEFTTLPGRFQARGKALSREGKASAWAQYAAEGVAWNEIVFPRTSGSVSYRDSVVELTVAGEDEGLGRYAVQGKLDLRKLDYSGTAELAGIVVRRFGSTLPDLRVDATVEFDGRSTDSIAARVGARVDGLGFDTLVAVGRFRQGTVELDTLHASGPSGTLTGAGAWSHGLVRVHCRMESLDLALARRFMSLEAEGRLTGNLAFVGTADTWNAEGRVLARGLDLAGVRIANGLAEFEVAFGRGLSGFAVVGGEEVRVGGRTFDAAQLILNGPEFDVRVDLPQNRLLARGNARLERTEVNLDVRMLEFATVQETLTVTRPFSLLWRKDSLQVQGAATAVAGGFVDLDVAMANGGLPDVKLRARGIDLAKLAELFQLHDSISGTMSLDIAGRDSIGVDLLVSRLRVPAIDMALSAAALRMNVTRNRAAIEHLWLVHTDSMAAAETSLVSGTVAYSTEGGFRLGEADLLMQLRNPGAWLLFILKPSMELRSGEIYGDLTLRGDLAEFGLKGRARVSRGVLAIPGMNATVERVNAEITFGRNRVSLQKITGRSGRGTVLLTGFLEMGRNWQVDSVHCDLELDGTGLNPSPELYAVVSGNLSIDWRSFHPVVLSGALTVQEGLVAVGFGQTANGSEQRPDTMVLYDLRIKGERGIWLRNQMADIEFTTDLSLRKTRTETVYSGELTSRQGTLYYLDHTLRVTSGLVKFENITRLNPDLDITAEMPIRMAVTDSGVRPPDKVVITLTGTLEQPNITYRSEPEGWGTEEIASYLNLNVTPDQLSALEQKDAVSKLLSERLLTYFQTQVSKRARGFVNLDYLEFESGLTGSKSTKVTVGKYIARNLYVSYTQNFTGEITPAFRIEYYLSRKNEILAERKDDGRLSLRYQFRLRY